MALENVMAVDNGKILGLHSETAANVPYDNSNSGLTADNVQEAVDELNSSLGDLIKYGFVQDETHSIAANSFCNWRYTLNVPTGYKLIGGQTYIASNMDKFSVVGYVNPYANANQIQAVARNLTSSAQTTNLAALYIIAKEDMVGKILY